MPKEEQIVTEGTVTEVLPGTMFRVDLGGQRKVLGIFPEKCASISSVLCRAIKFRWNFRLTI
jgi:translation initiation factor IF-1